MQTSESINEVAKAIALAQGSIRPAYKSSTNPHLKSKYADIASVWDAIRDPLSTNGLAALQDITADEFGVCVKTRIVHASGQWMEFGPLSIPMTKKDPQGFGSACTYAKRYALCAILGIVAGDEDDDGDRCTKDYYEESKEAKKETQKSPKDIETFSMEEAIKLGTIIGNDVKFRDEMFNYYSNTPPYKSRGKVVKDYIDLPKNAFPHLMSEASKPRESSCSK